MEREIRQISFDIRALKDGKRGSYITGRPIVYRTMTDLGYFNEIIEPGALANTDLRDVPFFVNHNIDMIPLARSRNNNANSTMQLSVIDEGMDIGVYLDTERNSDSRSLYSAVDRGDISGMSFMFAVDKDSWEDCDSDHPTRHILSIAKVFEVSAVTFPAYAATFLQARSLPDALESAKAILESIRAEERMRAIKMAKAKALAKAKI